MKAINKDFFREIKKNKGRFFSMLFIVALGVAFFSGIRASEPDMRISGDAYFDKYQLMDLQVMGTMGVTDADVSAIQEIDGVKKAEGAKSTDLLCNLEGNERVVRVMTQSQDMNLLNLSKGRMPEAADECVADEDFLTSFNLKVGDTLTLRAEEGTEISDTLHTDTFTIVGAGSSPQYISFSRGSSTVGTGDVQGFIVVPESSFSQEVYSSIYIQVEGAKEETAFTDGYQSRIDNVSDQVKAIEDARCAARYEEIVKEAEDKITEAEDKFAKEKKKTNEKLAKAKKKLDNGQKEIKKAKKTIADGEAQIKSAKATLSTSQKKITSGLKEYKAGKKKLESGKKELKKQEKAFAAKKKSVTKQIADGKAQLKTARTQLDQAWAQYNAVKDTLPPEQAAGMKAQLERQEKTYKEQSDKLSASEKQLADGEKKLKAAKEKLKTSETKLKNAKKKLDDGQKEIDEGKQTLAAKEKELQDGKAKILTSEKDLEDGTKKYEDGRKKADEEFAKAQKKIDDAKADVAKIETPKWYINDREDDTDYSGYGENADRMRAIGKVFPVIFFLVAALISLTTMTRMVEEQRIQIGTLKGLGYSKGTIAWKYVKYALYATVSGSVIGVLIGEKILPYIIIYAYGIMYKHMGIIKIPYDMYYAVVASGAAILCTLIATVLACYKELMAQPAVLMRPPAPKKGKRVLMERIPFLWKHLSFTWKSTIRNLMRYKKRFFMTVIGIGGCMGLMIVGFGLKDSIFEIVDYQYNQLQHYDGNIYLDSEATEEESAEITNYLNTSSDIKSYMHAEYSKQIIQKKAEQTSSQSAKKKQENVEGYLCVPSDVSGFKDYVVFRDRTTHEAYKLTDDGAILTEKAATMLDVKAGDTITMEDSDHNKVQVKISAICENYLSHYIYMSPKAYENVFGKTPEYTSILYLMKGSDDAKLLATGKDLLKFDGVLNLSYTYNMEERLSDMLGSLNLVIIVLIVSAGMLAFVVLYNLNNVNINERRREIATIKVLGFFDTEVGAYVYRENILLTFVGALAGLIIGNFLHRFIIVTVEVPSCMFGRTIHGTSYLYSFLFTVLFALIVNFVMYFKLKSIDMVESLKSIE